MTIEELFGTLQQATVASWRKHLRTAKYAKHEALDEFYKELPEKVDALIEGYMGAHGKKITKFENILKSSNMNTLKYLQELKKICKQGYDLLDENKELESLLDDIVNLINSTLYKVKELAESHSYPDLKDYIAEALIEEKKIEDLSGHSFDDICDIIVKHTPDLNWHRELSHNSIIDVMEYYTIFDNIERDEDISYDDLYDYIETYENEFKKYLKNL